LSFGGIFAVTTQRRGLELWYKSCRPSSDETTRIAGLVVAAAVMVGKYSIEAW
jgi:hypothetical protein